MSILAPVLSFGSLNIDHVYQLEQIVRPGETLTAESYSLHPGGKGLNQSIALARAGLSVCHAGRIGPDGQWLQEFLQHNKVDCNLVQVCAKQHSGHAVIQVAGSGENSIVLYSGANHSWDAAAIQALFQYHQWPAVVCQNEMNGLDMLLHEAYTKNIPVIFNAAPYSQTLQSLDLGRLHSLLVNETEAMSLSGEAELAAAYTRLKAMYPQVRLVLTLGARGVWASYRGQDLQLAASPAEVVDTTAAGDTFAGYYAASLLRYRPEDFQAALQLGGLAAAQAISRAGAAPSIPTIEQVRGV